MSKKKKTIIVLVIAAVVVAAGVFFLTRSGSQDDANAVYVDKISSINGSLGIVSRYSGKVEAQQTFDVKKDASRTVSETLVKVGDTVDVGTPLFQYDTSDAQDQIRAQQDTIRAAQDTIDGANEQISLDTAQQKGYSSTSEKYQELAGDITEQRRAINNANRSIESAKESLAQAQSQIDNSLVKSTVKGTVQSINESGMDRYGNPAAFISILQSGDYRVSGKVDEQSYGSISTGMSVIVRSRTDESKTWKGTITAVSSEPATDDNTGYYYGGNSGESSSKYPFYVALDSSEGLLLGQHVYIEPDEGQGQTKSGIWLDEYYLVNNEDGSVFVWADNGKGRLEKRAVQTGSYDQDLGKYEILSGLTEDDAIAFPDDTLQEGMKTISVDDMSVEGGL